MELRDYNGEGKWSRDEIIRRYARYCRELRIEPADLLSRLTYTEGDVTWIYPVMENVIDRIERGDAACRRIGIEFIEEDGKFPFGRILKSNIARALRRSDLSEEQKERIRSRAVAMLIAGNVPHEYKQYAKLLKKVGIGEHWDKIESSIDRSNPHVMRYYSYLANAL